LISFAESSLINGLRRPPATFFLFGSLPGPKARLRHMRRLFVSGSLSSLMASFRFPESHEASEGLAPFRSRTLGAPFVRPRRPRAPQGNRGTIQGPEVRGSR
jgi:hypothetical protein